MLGHALYMKAVHGGKTKNDRQDARTLARLLRGGTFPQAYVYPKETTSIRRRSAPRATCSAGGRTSSASAGSCWRTSRTRPGSQNTSWQYRLEPIGRRLANRRGRENVIELFDDDQVRLSVEVDLELVGHYDTLIRRLEWRLSQQALVHDRPTYDLLRSIPGVGSTLALVLLYEIDDSRRRRQPSL